VQMNRANILFINTFTGSLRSHKKSYQCSSTMIF